MSVIEIRGLSKKFGKNVVLDNIDLVIHEGDVVAIIGPSGTGKSTLLRSINLLEKPEKGTIKINDQEIDLTTRSAREKLELRKNTEMVFQQFNLFKNRTALENVMEGLLVVKKAKEKRGQKHCGKALAEGRDGGPFVPLSQAFIRRAAAKGGHRKGAGYESETASHG